MYCVRRVAASGNLGPWGKEKGILRGTYLSYIFFRIKVLLRIWDEWGLGDIPHLTSHYLPFRLHGGMTFGLEPRETQRISVSK
jgi:hypothetical protein